GLRRREEARAEDGRHPAEAQARQEGKERREDQELLRPDLPVWQEVPWHHSGLCEQGLIKPAPPHQRLPRPGTDDLPGTGELPSHVRGLVSLLCLGRSAKACVTSRSS